MSFLQVEVVSVEQLVHVTPCLVTIGVTVNMMGSCVTKSISDIGLETEEDSEEDIEEEDEVNMMGS